MAKKKLPADQDTGTGEDQGLIGQARHDIASAYDTASHLGDWLGHLDKGWDIFGLGGHSGSAPAAAAPAKKAAPKKAAAPATAPTEDAYQQLADAQAQQYLQMTKNLDPLTSGAALPAIEGQAAANATQMLGQSASSPVGQWLNQQTAAAQAQNAPVAAAMAQTSAAQDNANQLVAGGLETMGKAEAQMMQAAPYQQLLSSLAADVPYKLLSGYTLPQIQSTLKTSEQALGLSTAGAPTASAPQLPSINAGIIPGAPSSLTQGPPTVSG
jgi:hypothetical protein